MTYLSLTVCPKVDTQADELVYSGVGALIDESGCQGREREESQAGLETAVDAGAGEESKWPLPRQKDDPK